MGTKVSSFFTKATAKLPFVGQLMADRESLRDICRDLTAQRAALAGDRDELAGHWERLASKLSKPICESKRLSAISKAPSIKFTNW